MSAPAEVAPTESARDSIFALSERLYRIAAMLSFEAQAVAEVQHVRRTMTPTGGRNSIRAEQLDDALSEAATGLRSLAEKVSLLGTEVETIDHADATPQTATSPLFIADTYLDRAASVARGELDSQLAQP